MERGGHPHGSAGQPARSAGHGTGTSNRNITPENARQHGVTAAPNRAGTEPAIGLHLRMPAPERQFTNRGAGDNTGGQP